jgi:hypothetical protein
MFRTELPRLYDLKDCIRDPNSFDAYFLDFENRLVGSAHVKDVYVQLENTLQGLDAQAWEHLKSESRSLLTARHHGGRGWQQLFDILSEARAYNYLKSRAATNLRFIPRARERTPDLECFFSLDRVLCEVKSINISDDEVAYRINPVRARSLASTVSPEFLKKLRQTIENAQKQLLAFDPTRSAKHIVYLNVVFDDFLAECKEAYFRQIDRDLAESAKSDTTLVICNDHTAFYKPLRMQFAEVDNLGPLLRTS